jgi:arginyl-tRNA synthetase
VIPGDIGAELGLRASGTWRPVPAVEGGGPGSYATSLAFQQADASGRTPGEEAADLAARLRGTDWVSAASVTGGGYLTVTVTQARLAGLAVRVPAAGAVCAASDALRGTELTAPAEADPASAATWSQARQAVAEVITGRLALAAGAEVKSLSVPVRNSPPPRSAPYTAVAFAGADAVRYALARTAPGRQGGVSATTWARNDLGNPFFAVRYAHAHAASVLRWAAGLGLDRGPAGAFRPGELAHPAELELLSLMSWLPERTAAAARRRRPDAFFRYLEALAAAWLACWESCAALPFAGRAAPRDETETAARLWLAAAAQTALGTALRLGGLVPPERV